MYRKLGLIMVVAFFLIMLVVVIGATNQGNARLTAVNDQLEGELAEVASNWARIEADLVLARSIGELRDGEVSDLQSQMVDLKTQKTKLQTERDVLVTHIVELNASIEQLNVQADDGKLHSARLAERLSSTESRAGDLGGLLKKRDERIESLEADLDQILLDLKIGEDKIMLFETLLDKQNERGVILAEERKQLLQEKAGLDAKVADLSRHIEFLQSAIDGKSEGETERVEILANFLAQFAVDQKGNAHRVVPICFAPKGASPCSKELVGKINRAMAEVQAWYYYHLGRTFEWDLAVAVQGEQSSLWYYGEASPYIPYSGGVNYRILTEVASQSKRASQDTIYAIFFQGEIPAFALGEKSYFVNYSIFGDRFMDYLISESAVGSRLAVGTVAHELGHALGLEHSTVPGTVTWEVADDANIFGGFSEDDLKILGESPFLR